MSVRKDQKIAVTVASSSIAATLLTGGRTAHSVLKLIWHLKILPSVISANIAIKAECCDIVKFLVWDESAKSHKKATEDSSRFARQYRYYEKNGSFTDW